MTVWWLYLYLGTMGTVQMPDPFATKAECMKHGDKEVADFRAFHTRAPAWRWCVRGNRSDTP